MYAEYLENGVVFSQRKSVWNKGNIFGYHLDDNCGHTWSKMCKQSHLTSVELVYGSQSQTPEVSANEKRALLQVSQALSPSEC